jgi:hypothetical protein
MRVIATCDNVCPLYIEHTLLCQYGHTKLMTQSTRMAMKPCMGRKKRWPERVGAKFAAGTMDRIAAALADGEERTAFIREAVERELERRERAAAKTIPSKRR